MDAKRYKIIYEDDWLMIVDKPSGMLVIPSPKKETNTLTGLLNRELDERKVDVNAYPCHRLDRETSGLVIYAKGKKIQGLMMEEFKEKKVKKAYIAFVHGNVKKDFDIINRKIYSRNKGRLQEAVTKYSVVERRKDFTILKVEPITGRTNQIRIHLAEYGHPLVGESVFVFRKDFPLKFKRAALHAEVIEFIHPISKEKMKFSAPLAKDMEGFIAN